MYSTVAIDIGASRMRAGSYTIKSIEPIRYNQIPTRSEGMPIEDRLVNLIESVWPEDHEVKSIAAACPGPLDPINGIIVEPPNIPEWRYFPIQEFLQSTFDIPTAINNDANLAALGEWAASRASVFLSISLSVEASALAFASFPPFFRDLPEAFPPLAPRSRLSRHLSSAAWS